MTGRDERAFRRILFALDVRSSRDPAVPTTVSLAARVGAELDALFIEDVDLLRAAGLPSAAELSVPGGMLRPVDRRGVEAQLAALSAAARNTLASEARTHRLSWTFRVARGRVADEILAASGRADLVVLGRRTRAAVGGRDRSRAARKVAAEARSSVLLLAASGIAGRGAAVVYDDSASAWRALELGARLAERGARFTLLLASNTAAHADHLAQSARAAAPLGTTVVARWLGGAHAADLIRAAKASDALIVVGSHSPVLQGDGLESLLDGSESAILIAR